MRRNTNCKWFVDYKFCTNPEVVKTLWGFGARVCISNCGYEESLDISEETKKMTYIQRTSECDHKTCKGGQSIPGKFGGWQCECYCHKIREMCNNIIEYCNKVSDEGQHCKTDCIIKRQCEELDDYDYPCFWQKEDVDKMIEIIIGE